MRPSTAVLAAGYVLSVPFSVYTPGFLRLWRRREPLVFAAEEVGAALVTAGWAMRGNVPNAAFNAAWTVGLAGAYALEGRKRRRAA